MTLTQFAICRAWQQMREEIGERVLEGQVTEEEIEKLERLTRWVDRIAQAERKRK